MKTVSIKVNVLLCVGIILLFCVVVALRVI